MFHFRLRLHVIVHFHSLYVGKSYDNLRQRVQALADISRSALYCHSNETRAPIATKPNSAQLEGTLNYSPSYIRVRAALWECGEG